MDAISTLVSYLVIAAAIHWVLNLPIMGLIRRAMDFKLNRQSSNHGDALKFSAIGESEAYEDRSGTDSHQATVGPRLLSTILTVVLLGMLGLGKGAPPRLGNGITRFLTYAVLLLISGHYLIYMWTNRVDISAFGLTVPNYHQPRRTLDSRGLVRIEDNRAYALRLYFEDGSRAEVLKYVTGRQALLARLTAQVNRNARG